MSYQVPIEGSRGYIRVVARGCDGKYDSFAMEYYCGHEYQWTCEECPWLRDKRAKEEARDETR